MWKVRRALSRWPRRLAAGALTRRSVRIALAARANEVGPTEDADWYEGTLERTGARGIFPGNFVEFLQPEKPKVGRKPHPAAVPSRPVSYSRLGRLW